MNRRNLLAILSIVAAVLSFQVSGLAAQSASTGALTGTVTDPSGAVVPNVTVTTTSVATNLTRNTTTGADGVYRFSLLDPGKYRVGFRATGFASAEIPAVQLVVTQTSVLNYKLDIGQQVESVTVDATVESLQTVTSALGSTIDANTIAVLPLSARNFTTVLGLFAGVAVDAANGTAYGRGTQNMSVNGANPEKNNFQMDGVSINNASGNNEAADFNLYTGIAIPNPDAIQEVRIQTSTYDASYGRNPGANVNVVTRSGANQFHGTLFEFFRNEALNANDFFYNRDKLPGAPEKQILRQNQFGGSLGGPIKRDKLFFFGTYQGTRQLNGVAPQGITSATLYPVPDNREATDFPARLGAAMCGFATRGTRIACDGSNINPVAVALLRVKLNDGSYYIPGSSTSATAQRLFSIPARFDEDQGVANADWFPNAKHSLQARFMTSNGRSEYQLMQQLPGRVQVDERGNTSGVLRWTSIPGSSVVNQGRVSFQRIVQRGSDTVPYTAQQIGLNPMIAGSANAPIMSISGAFNIGGGMNPSYSPTTQIQYSDQFSWTRQSHTVRAGFEFENVRWPLTLGGLGRGILIVNSFPDLLIGRAGCAAANTGCSPASPGNTTGLPFSSFNACLFCVRSSVNGIVHNYAVHNMNAFIQDDWKVNPKLTLNVGVRWERNGTLADKYGNLTDLWASDLATVPVPPAAPSFSDPMAFAGYVVPDNYDARPVSEGGHGPLPAGVRQVGGGSVAKNRIPLSNFGPRIGFAWQPAETARLVVRGGFGIYYDRVGLNRMVHAVQQGKPYADTITLQHDIASLQSPFQDRPLAFLPRWYDFTTLTGSNFDSSYYEKLQTPLSRQYNLNVQYEFLRHYVFEVAYVGSSGINVGDYNHVVNTARLASPSAPIHGITTNTVQNASARVPYLGFTPNGLQAHAFDGVYNYNSLQTTVSGSPVYGLGVQLAYTWSKNLSDVGFNAANLNNPTDLKQQYGETPYSRPHRFVVSYRYELPFRSAGVLKNVVEGWSLSGVTLVQSGNPLTLFDGRGGTIWGMPNSTTIEKGVGRAQLCPGVTYSQIATSGSVKDRLGSVSNPNTPRYFQLSAFCAPPSIGNGTDFGDSGVGIVRGPGQANFDAALIKSVTLREGQLLQLRAEFYNLFNHAQFAIPATVGNQALYASNPALFGVITSTSVNPRLVQIALRYQF